MWTLDTLREELDKFNRGYEFKSVNEIMDEYIKYERQIYSDLNKFYRSPQHNIFKEDMIREQLLCLNELRNAAIVAILDHLGYPDN